MRVGPEETKGDGFRLYFRRADPFSASHLYGSTDVDQKNERLPRSALMASFSLLLFASCTGNSQDDVDRLASDADSSKRAVWMPAAAGLGLKAAAGDAALRDRIWREAHVNTVGMRFAHLPSGTLERPASLNLPGIEIPRGFYIAVTETTNAQYAALFPEFTADPLSPDPDSPAVNVDWKGAIAFCERLSAREGHVYRLPTSDEWRYACQSGSMRRHVAGPFGPVRDLLPEHGWNDRSLGRSQGVALLKPNKWGVYDMLGNAGELASRSDGRYRSTTAPASGQAAAVQVPVIRGGNWYSTREACSCDIGYPRPLLSKAPFSTDPPWQKVVSFRVVREEP
jgi:formylglycine-generating enzyme required for sulfatase activity